MRFTAVQFCSLNLRRIKSTLPLNTILLCRWVTQILLNWQRVRSLSRSRWSPPGSLLDTILTYSSSSIMRRSQPNTNCCVVLPSQYTSCCVTCDLWNVANFLLIYRRILFVPCSTLRPKTSNIFQSTIAIVYDLHRILISIANCWTAPGYGVHRKSQDLVNCGLMK